MLGCVTALSMIAERQLATEALADLGIRLTTAHESRSSASLEWRTGGGGGGLAAGDVGCTYCACCDRFVPSLEQQRRQCQTGRACASLTFRPAHMVCHRVLHEEQRMAAFLVDVLVQPPQVLGRRESETLDSSSEMSIIHFVSLLFRKSCSSHRLIIRRETLSKIIRDTLFITPQ